MACSFVSVSLAVLLLLLGSLQEVAKRQLQVECPGRWRTALQIHQGLRHVGPIIIIYFFFKCKIMDGWISSEIKLECFQNFPEIKLECVQKVCRDGGVKDIDFVGEKKRM